MALAKEDQEEIKRHMGVLQESFIKEVKTIGEGQSFIREDIQDAKNELKQESNETKTQMQLGFNHINKRLDKIEKMVEKHEEKLSHP